jgi:predicted MFS family arabinose efflux permease
VHRGRRPLVQSAARPGDRYRIDGGRYRRHHLPPDADKSLREDRLRLDHARARPYLPPSRLPPARNATAHPDLRIFRQLPFLFAAIGLFLLEFSLFIPLAYVSTYAMHVGFSEDFAYHLLPIMNAGSVLGRVLPGYYADVFGPFNTCMFSVVLSIVACLCVWLPSGHTTAGIIVFSILFGFASGTGIAVAPVCIGRLCKTQEYGRYYATAYTIVSIACLIGIPIAGSIIEANDGEYEEVIVATSVVYVGSFAFLMWAKTAKLGWKKWHAAY